MTVKRHGISIGVNRINDSFYVGIKAIGKLTHEDYEFMTPVLEDALKEVKAPKIKVIFDGTEFEGWNAHAAWDDFKLGMKHNKEFSKIAFVGNKPWEKVAAKVGGWFVKGEIKYFEDYDAAVDWVEED